MLNILKKIIGTKNEREIKRISSVVEQICALEPAVMSLTDTDLQAKTAEFRTRIADGETLDDQLPEAFAD
jgi:preprotein translocase subunit SecA